MANGLKKISNFRTKISFDCIFGEFSIVSDKKLYLGKIDGNLPSGQRELVHTLKIFHKKPSKIIRNFNSEIQNQFSLSICHFYSQQEKQQKQQQYGAIKIAKKAYITNFSCLRI